MQERVDSFSGFATMMFCVEAMEQGLLHVDAVNSNGNTLGIVLSIETSYSFEFQNWLRYWALKPSVQKFWAVLCASSLFFVCPSKILRRTALIPALWEDLSFIYNLATAEDVDCLGKEVERRVSASLRFAWIAAVVGRQI